MYLRVRRGDYDEEDSLSFYGWASEYKLSPQSSAGAGETYTNSASASPLYRRSKKERKDIFRAAFFKKISPLERPSLVLCVSPEIFRFFRFSSILPGAQERNTGSALVNVTTGSMSLFVDHTLPGSFQCCRVTKKD
ncbi:hypothetical protein PROFUN_11506 [Planoprotostelium fungivorum]|uniref:Uncharacterized protein n=1 Tax=Planoprotostelium fungivorum TaxID=1890364 RepID=A0A2P6N9Y2_9EUKA|nr:hypothetical protein PROFUN_11506 [Planoprotostelium fungivorum]